MGMEESERESERERERERERDVLLAFWTLICTQMGSIYNPGINYFMTKEKGQLQRKVSELLSEILLY